ncbi:MAG: ADP-forming succinate--CoA ligase subunit beta [Bacillota bacterium]
MKLYEHLAKEVFAKNGIPTPPGRVAMNPDEVAAVAKEIGAPVAIKAQILAGGRGKAGGIKFADDPEQARAVAKEMFGADLKGFKIDRLLVEKKLKIENELYVGVAVDAAAKQPLLIASAKGGMSIEEVPEKDIVKRPVDITWGLYPYAAREVVHRLGLTGAAAKKVAEIMVRLYRIFRAYDAELVEINPLIISAGAGPGQEEVIAADGRLNVDDYALFRHKDLPVTDEGTALEKRVKAIGLAYVELDGDIAVMANGAGMAMATLDILSRYGGRPANFLDAGGGASSEPMAQAIDVLLSTNPKAMLINIFGGITRCDEVAKAVLSVKQSRGIPVPLVVRLVGTNEAEGVRLLREAGISAYRSLDEAAAKVVAAAGGAK